MARSVILITVPWLMEAEKWAICSQSSRRVSMGNANIFAFEPWAVIDEDFNWPDYLKCGSTLVRKLYETCKNDKVLSSSRVSTLPKLTAPGRVQACRPHGAQHCGLCSETGRSEASQGEYECLLRRTESYHHRRPERSIQRTPRCCCRRSVHGMPTLR